MHRAAGSSAPALTLGQSSLECCLSLAETVCTLFSVVQCVFIGFGRDRSFQ